VPLTDADLLALPKVELHVHLEGTVAASTAAQLARDRGEDPLAVLEVEAGDDGEVRYPTPFTNFDQFVRAFVATSGQLQTPHDLQAATAAFVAEQQRQGVVWTEATFTATTLVWQGWDPAAMWDAVATGIGDAPVGLIVDSPRNLGTDNAWRAVQLVEDALARDLPIVGLGLTGPETSADVRDFALLRDEANRLGLGLAIHAGETGGPDQIAGALAIGADRIGHGVASVHDEELLAELASRGVVCEVCPSSNVTLNVVASLDDHPLPAMARAGVAVTINSDDPPFFGTTLTQELRHAERLLDLDRAGHATLQRRAAEAAFLPRSRRDELLAAIDAWARG
jgi:adenosine deaminase